MEAFGSVYVLGLMFSVTSSTGSTRAVGSDSLHWMDAIGKSHYCKCSKTEIELPTRRAEVHALGEGGEAKS